MRHLKKFNSINENHTHENDVDIIIDTMQDFLDDDRNILFKSPIGDMRYRDYVDKNSNYIIHNKVPKIYPGKWVEVLKGNNNKDSIYLTTGAIIQHVINNFLKKKNYFLYSLPLWGMKFKKNQFNYLKKYKKISVVEDHFQDGGFQSWLSESLKNKSLETVVISKSINYKVVGKVGSKEYLMKYLY